MRLKKSYIVYYVITIRHLKVYVKLHFWTMQWSRGLSISADLLIYAINYRYLVLHIFHLEIRKHNNNKSTNKTNTGKANIQIFHSYNYICGRFLIKNSFVFVFGVFLFVLFCFWQKAFIYCLNNFPFNIFS